MTSTQSAIAMSIVGIGTLVASAGAGDLYVAGTIGEVYKGDSQTGGFEQFGLEIVGDRRHRVEPDGLADPLERERGSARIAITGESGERDPEPPRLHGAACLADDRRDLSIELRECHSSTVHN